MDHDRGSTSTMTTTPEWQWVVIVSPRVGSANDSGMVASQVGTAIDPTLQVHQHALLGSSAQSRTSLSRRSGTSSRIIADADAERRRKQGRRRRERRRRKRH